jgi:hypothetical protein
VLIAQAAAVDLIGAAIDRARRTSVFSGRSRLLALLFATRPECTLVVQIA